MYLRNLWVQWWRYPYGKFFGAKACLALTLGIGAIAASETCVKAQNITLDGSLGTARTLNGPNYDIRQQDGQTVGNNLFHSFGKFNLDVGERANFLSNPGIVNIFSRVTGGTPSNINGVISSLGSNANLFLINPSGIVFGPNATLDIRGSFVATTASGVQFPDGGIFSATSPNVPAPTLTVNPSAFFFNQTTGAINNQGNLQVPEGQSLFLLGGNVSLDGGTVRAPGGRVELGGLAATGTVTLTNAGKLQFPDGVARGDVSLSNGAIADVVAGNGGDIAITARNINISGSTTYVCAGIGSAGSACDSPGAATGSSTSQAGNILFDATGAVSISQSRIENNINRGATGNTTNNIFFEAINNDNLFGSILIQAGSVSLTEDAQLSTTTFGRGNAGAVIVQANNGQVSLDNSNIFSNVGRGAQGDAGGILIQSGTVSLRNNAQLQAGVITEGRGDGGLVFIEATGEVSLTDAQIFSDVEFDAQGTAGGISIKSGSLTMTEGARLESSTAATQDTNGQPSKAGAIALQVNNDITLNNSDIFNNLESGAVGQGGEINIQAGSLSLLNGAQVQTLVRKADGNQPAANGTAGTVTVNVRDRLNIAGANNQGQPSAIFSTLNTGAIGASGKIDITAGSVSLSDGGQLDSSTAGRGDAGLISVKANDVSLEGIPTTDFKRQTAIISGVKPTGEGNAGGIVMDVGSLSMSNGALIRTETQGVGNAGIIAVQATGAVSLVGVQNPPPGETQTGIFTTIEPGANADTNKFFGGIFDFLLGTNQENLNGAIAIKANSLSLTDGAQLNASTFGDGSAGAVFVVTDEAISLDTGSRILSGVGKTATNASGGGIVLKAESVSMNNGSNITTQTEGQGDAGLIVVLANGDVSARGQGSGIFSTVFPDSNGSAGGIGITADRLLLWNGAVVNVNNAGGLEAGAIVFQGRRVVLNEGSFITATTRSGNGGNIDLSRVSEYVAISRGSDITTTAEPGSGNGGNIDIFTPFLVSTPRNNNDIIAKAVSGTGGRITISALKLFDIERRSVSAASNDINASANRNAGGQDGIEDINSPNIDPTGITELPSDLVDPSSLIAQTCRPGERGLARGTFTNVGRVGVPANPGDALRNNAVLDGESSPVAETPTARPSNQIVEAQGWVRDAEGNTVFTAFAPNATPQSPAFKTPACP